MFKNIKVVNTTDKTTAGGKPFKALSIMVEGEDLEQKVNIFSDFPDFANIKADSIIRGKLEPKGQYLNLISETQAAPRGGKPNMDRVMEKKADMVAVAQDKKAQNIAQAQDRSAWMWAKNNAAMLIANSPALKTMNKEKMADAVIDLATLIYNGEPTEPFSSKPQNIKTAPIEGMEYPEEEINPNDIPF